MSLSTEVKIPMLDFLRAVDTHGTTAREALLAAGHHPNVIYAKALKAAAKGYTEYGTVADRPWLTDRGRDFLNGETGWTYDHLDMRSALAGADVPEASDDPSQVAWEAEARTLTNAMRTRLVPTLPPDAPSQ